MDCCRCLGLVLSGFLVLVAAEAGADGLLEPPPPRAVQEKDFRTFLAWFEGEFDSNEQVAFAEELGIPRDAVPERIHSIFRRVDLAAFGEHVFYVEQYLDGDPAKIYRQRLYSFSLDDAEQAIKLVIHIPADVEALVGAHRDLSKLVRLTPAGTRTPPGCEVYWRRRGDAFIGAMKSGACRIVSQRSGTTIVVSDDLYLDDDEIWIHDRAVDEQGGYVYGNKAGIPNKLRKVSWFACWLSVRRDGVADGDPKAWSFDRNIAVHDEVAVDPAKAVGYGWADPGAQRLGINLRWMQVSCSQRP